MKTKKGGFTLIEVALFLAITGLLFLGVTIGVQNSIFQQRYNDSVQNFVEFLRSAYAKVENVQGKNSDMGNTNRALYGKLITFGERLDLNGKENEDAVFMYDIVGNAKCSTSGSQDVVEMLVKDCNADVFKKDGKLLGSGESYMPRWSAVIQNTNRDKAELFKGALIITRHPQTGTVNTYAIEGTTVEINSGTSLKTFLKGNNKFLNSKDVDFCINPNGNDISNIRADVRIKAGARNTSGIEIMPDSENRCADRG